MTDDEKYVLAPLGLLETIGVERKEAKRIMDAFGLHLRRHYGTPSAVVFDGKEFLFSKLGVAE